MPERKDVACETHDLVVMQVLSAAYAFGIRTHAELAGLHEQRAISLAWAGLPLAAFMDNLTSVKVCTAICLSVCLFVCLPHSDTDTTNQNGHPDIACLYFCLSASCQVVQKCCQEAVVYVCAFACSWT